MNLLSQREIHVLIQILKHFTLNIILISQRRVKTVRRGYNAYNSWNLVALMEFNHFIQNKNFCFSTHLGISLICAIIIVQFSSVQSLSRVRLFLTPWIAAHQASLSITNSRSLFKLMSIELVMPSSHHHNSPPNKTK